MKLLGFLLALVVLPACVNGLYDENDSVFQLTSDTFQTLVLDTHDYWVVEFYAPWCGHCQNLAPEYKKAAKSLLGLGKLGAVDCTEQEDICQKYEVAGYPTIKVFAEGGKSDPGSDYDGDRNADGIIEYVRRATGEEKENVAHRLVSKLKYLEMFTFLFQIHFEVPKVIFFMEGEAEGFIPGWFITLAGKYKKGRAKDAAFGVASLDTEDGMKIAKRFDISSPTVVVVKPEGENKGWYIEMEEEIATKGSANTKHAQEILEEVLVESITDEEKLELPAFPEPSKPRQQATPTFTEATAENIAKDCYKHRKKNICIMALVEAVDAQERVYEIAFEEYPAVAEISKKYRNDPIAFVWVDAPKQDEFLQAYGLAWQGSPKVLAVKTGKRNRYAIMEGDITEDNMSNFVDKILGGDMQFKMYKGDLPELVPDYILNVGSEPQSAEE